MSTVDSVWREQDTTPEAIENALRELLHERHAHDTASVPARVLNLVAVVDAEWSGEVANRLRGVGRYHASRTIVCAVRHGHDRLDATVSVAAETQHDPHTPVTLRELVVITCGERHLEHLETIVDPLVVTDLATVLWAPHGHIAAIAAMLRMAQVVLCDSVDEPDVGEALRQSRALHEQAYVVDLAWLRSTPWRERVAASFDPPYLRAELGSISEVMIRHHPESGAAALLLVGWLASRLGWTPSALDAKGDSLQGTLDGGEHVVSVRLEPDPALMTRGLAGIALRTASGRSLQLDRGSGGLRAHARDKDGRKREWTILGASRGESGILGEGIRQALLRDPTYRPALAAAAGMAP
jgi:glucose-6-phosphate dehydrogenase assembly protein OpcA